MKIKLLLLILVIGCTQLAMAQDQFIEVRVSTELMLQANKLIYQTPAPTDESSLFGDFDFDEYGDDEYDYEEEYEEIDPTKDIEKVLKKNGYIYTTNDNDGFDVELTSAKELETLKSLLDNISGANGKVGTVKFESEEKYYDLIFTDLLRKAKLEASTIAKLTNQTLGKILHVRDSEAQAFDMNNYKDMLNMKNLMGTMFGLGDEALEEKYERELIFKFAVE